MKSARTCPICPDCGSKKFHRINDSEITIQCSNCKKILKL